MKPDYSTVVYALPGMIILVILESIELIRDHKFGKGSKAMLASLFIGIVAIAAASTTKGAAFLFYNWIYQFRLVTIPTHSMFLWVLCFFGDDLTYYWFHRAGHQIRFFWASHIVHHSPQTFTLTTAFRLPWTSHFTGNFLFWAWMPLLGIPASAIITIKAVSTLYQLWLHTEKIKKLPKPIEWFFNTPSHHRVHHGTDPDHLDTNYGGTLIIWDRLFGTFCPETHKATYGLTKNIDSHNPFVIAFYEWGNLARDLASSRNLRDCFNYLFNSPGWNNSGKIKTTKALRSTQATRKPTDTNLNSVNVMKALNKPNQAGIFTAVVMLFFFTDRAFSQERLLSYNIMMGGSKIGSLTMARRDSLNTTSIKINCQARKRIIFLYTVSENQEAYFDHGVMQRSYVYRRVNSNVKIDQHTQFRDGHYVVNKADGTQNLMIGGVGYNQTSLYFTEPTGIRQLYSDIYMKMLDIRKVSNGIYQLTLPDGNVNYYYYTDGVCSRVKIDRTLFSVEFVLVK